MQADVQPSSTEDDNNHALRVYTTYVRVPVQIASRTGASHRCSDQHSGLVTFYTHELMIQPLRKAIYSQQ